MKKLIAIAGLLLATTAARADDKTGLLVAAANLTIAKCIAPTINPSLEADFNYFADAMTLTSLWSASKEEVDRGTRAAIKLLEQEGEATFCERGKRGFDAMIADARKHSLPVLIAGRKAWENMPPNGRK